MEANEIIKAVTIGIEQGFLIIVIVVNVIALVMIFFKIWSEL